MQNRYVGDIGDYVKFALLRCLMPDYKLGVAWWLYEDEHHNKNGRHVEYQSHPAKWRHYDPDLYDGLRKIIDSGIRDVRQIEQSGLLPNAVFHNTLVPVSGTPAERRSARAKWYEQAKIALADSDLIFIDPDNGLETAGFSAGAKVAGKSVSIAELLGLSKPGQTLIVYHHQTRRRGGHLEELSHWSTRLRGAGFQSVDAIRSGSYSPRAFFLLNAPPDLRHRAVRLVHRWNRHLTWHPATTSTAEPKPLSMSPE